MPLTNKRKKYLRKWYKKNKEYWQEYYQKNKARIYENSKERKKEYYLKNREVFIERAKKWNKDNPRKACKHSSNWYFKKKMESKLLCVKQGEKETEKGIDKN